MQDAGPAEGAGRGSRSDEVPNAVTHFLLLSERLTGFDAMTLQGTGMVECFFDEVTRIIGSRELGSLLGAFLGMGNGPDADIKRAILDNARYGPVARNIITMWYLGAWNQLPRVWRDAYGATAFDTDHVVSPAAYRESLVWPAAGTHPMSAKQPGFASWAVPSTVRSRP